MLIAAVGLYWVKWNPYYHKAFTAMAHHSIGASIVSGHSGTAPKPSWNAAITYAYTYFKAIWQALVLGVLLGSLVQVLVPRYWIVRVLGKKTFGSTVTAGLLGIPSMMCTCCSAPIVVGLRKSNSSVGAAVAYWTSNTALNPAVLVFMCFVLSWKFAILRIVLGIALVFGVSYLANKIGSKHDVDLSRLTSSNVENSDSSSSFVKRWINSLWTLIIGILPAYVVSVLILGAVRAWLFPTVSPAWAHSILAMIGLAIVGTLFVIPTAGEIPIVQTLQSFGLGFGPAAALMFTLPVVSLPSMLMVSRALSWRILAFVAGSVVVLGVLGGLMATWLF